MLFGGPGLFKLLQTFWGVIVLLGVGSYSLYDAVAGSDEAPPPPLSRRLADAPSPTAGPPRPTPIGGFPTPAPLTLFLACNGQDADSASHYVPAPGGYVTLRLDVDRELIVAVMAGEPTRFPANANLVQTPCVRGRIRSGTFP